jgi:hypothetical protein
MSPTLPDVAVTGGAVEDRLDVVAVGVTDEGTEVLRVIFGP